MIWGMVPLGIITGYLFGALPVDRLICRLYRVEIRRVDDDGGATSGWRTAGLKAALPILMGDAAKGVIAIWLLQRVYRLAFPETGAMDVEEATLRYTALKLSEVLTGAFAVIGHHWSIYRGFTGSRNGITSAAVTMMISPLVGSIVWLIGALLLWWTRIASIATVAMAVSSFAIFLVLYLNQSAPWPYLVYGVSLLVIIMGKLQENREKLRTGAERVIPWQW